LAAIWIFAHSGILQAQSGSADPAGGDPVHATMKLSRKEAAPGDALSLVVQVRIDKGYHLYSATGANSPFIPTTVELTLPKGVEAAGDWTPPKPFASKDGTMIYTNLVTFRRALKVKADAPAKTLTISGELHFQACDEKTCFPPNTLELEATVQVAGKTNTLATPK
jgi:DsbC/DsbD-like thiol-disulfide interchange protein